MHPSTLELSSTALYDILRSLLHGSRNYHFDQYLLDLFVPERLRTSTRTFDEAVIDCDVFDSAFNPAANPYSVTDKTGLFRFYIDSVMQLYNHDRVEIVISITAEQLRTTEIKARMRLMLGMLAHLASVQVQVTVLFSIPDFCTDTLVEIIAAPHGSVPSSLDMDFSAYTRMWVLLRPSDLFNRTVQAAPLPRLVIAQTIQAYFDTFDEYAAMLTGLLLLEQT